MTLVAILFGLARRLMPLARVEWLDAMHAESERLHGVERTRWACGAFVTALKQRFAPMDTGNYRVSRWVMLVEALGAFGPLTIGWWEVTFGGSGLARLSPAIIEKAFMHFPGGPYILAMQIVGGVLGILGPIGLFLGLRYVLTGQGIRNRRAGWALIALPIVAHVAGTIAGYLVGPADFSYSSFGFWFYTVMLTAVPVAVVWHLMALERSASSIPPPVTVAA
jgi:hypothetical protein